MKRTTALACVLLVLWVGGGVAMAGALEDLWVINVGKSSAAERTLAVTLQGLVSKDREFRQGIWVAGGGMYALVLEELRAEGTKIHKVDSAWKLLARFRDRVKGVVVYKLGTDSLNVATSLCGPKRAVAVDESILGKARAQGLSVLLDVRGYDEARAYEEFKNLFARGVLVEQAEKKNWHLRGFAVARDAFTFYGVEPEERTRFVRELGPGAMVFGWGDNEHKWVQQTSRGGGTGVPADWATHLSVRRRRPVPIPERPRRYPEPAKKGERIVAFVMSDGDNIQWMGGPFVKAKGFWASSHRGKFNMTWEMAPILAEVSARTLRHFYRTASTGTGETPGIDDFVVGPSGAGYSFHNDLPDRRAFAEATARYMRKSRLSIVTLLNLGGEMSQSRELLERPEVAGALYKDYAPYNKRKGEIYWHKGKPCISFRYLLWEPRRDKGPEGVAEAISRLPASPLTDQRSYAAINVHAWSFGKIGGPMEAVKRTIDLLPDGTRVVTAEELIVLLRNNFGTPVPRPR